jgi:hypothetical protein
VSPLDPQPRFSDQHGGTRAARGDQGGLPFSGRSGRGGRTETNTLSCFADGEVVHVERLIGCDKLAAPVWDRFGAFAGHAPVRGTVT